MSRFNVGHRFPSQSVHLAPEKVARYLAAVGSESPAHRSADAVAPPLAIAAWVIAGLIEAIDLPPGSVHATQDFSFMQAAAIGSTLSAEAEVVQSATRGGMDVIVVEITAMHEQEVVLTGRSMLIMPLAEDAE